MSNITMKASDISSVGRQTVVLHGCNLNGGILAKFMRTAVINP